MDLPELRRVVVIGDRRTGFQGDLIWDEFLSAGEPVPPEDVQAREASLGCQDAINIQYTSGTTGNPKGATLTHHNILNNAKMVAETLRYSAADRVCIPVPLYHCFGMGVGNLGCVVSGATMVYPAPSFEPLATLEAIAEERCTSIYGVPTMFIAQLEHPEFAKFDLTSLRTGIMAGAPCPIETMKRVISDMHAREVCIAYGMTETSPVSFITRPSDSVERRVSTVGTVATDVEAKVVDTQTGETVPISRPGEVCTRGYLVMRGYWKDPEATAEAVDAEGWMHSGDAGYFNNDKQLVIIDRIKDLAETSRGERFSPQYLENKLKFSPYIAEAVVLGAGRDTLAAMICIRYSIISKWAEKNRISFTTYTDLSSRPEVYALLRKEVEGVNATLPPAQRISRFILLYKELDADDGELTRTRKVRRNVINEKYATIIDAIYGGKSDIPVDTMIRFQDGTTQRIRTTLRVVDLGGPASMAEAAE